MRLSLIGASCIALVAGTAYVLRLPVITVRDIAVEGNESITASQVEHVVREQLQGSYLFLVPRSNIFFIPKGDIIENIASQIKTFKRVGVKRSGLSRIVVVVEERQPFALWCEGTSDTQCFFLDDEGYVYREAPTFGGDVYVRYRGLIEGDPIGQVYAPSMGFRELAAFVESVDELVVLDVVPAEVMARTKDDYILTSKGGSDILFGGKDTLSGAYENLETVLANAAGSVGGTFDDLFEYIDLRFGNKVFYKEK